VSSDISVPPAGDGYGDLLQWTRYFDQLDVAMHDFEAALARQDVEPLRQLTTPRGRPPEVLHLRWTQAQQRITELEFRARSLREELRIEFARLSGGRRVVQSRTNPGYGPSLDITG
jgi:hypothetical protein